MCGIAGIFDTNIPPTAEELNKMVAIQVHRGPDSSGTYIHGPIALGMRRLAIIDMKSGSQPVFNEDGMISVVFNGEIFNYVELRAALESKGHRFKTSTDTEVLVHLYEDAGTEMLNQLNGMFAFALWDARNRRLFVARDRLGVKPLYYAEHRGRLFFASELKALFTNSSLPKSVDENALADFFRIGYISGEATPFRSVKKLKPGHLLIRDMAGYRIKQWWSLQHHVPHEASMDRELDSEALSQLLDDSIRLRMRSDVPVATFLSGGMDSTLVSASAKHFAGSPLKAYTAAFENPLFDETEFAKKVAIQNGFPHEVLTISPSSLLQLLPRLLWHMDEPIADGAMLPTYLISQRASKDVKVCLSGLGGDELFGGYSRYEQPIAGTINKLLSPFPQVAAVLAPAVGRLKYAWGEEFRIATGAKSAWRHYLSRIQTFNPVDLKAAGWSSFGNTDDHIRTLWEAYPSNDPVGRLQFIDHHTYLPDQILALTDRMSMAASLEVRVPFMDYRLVQLAAKLPTHLKQVNGEYKIALKRAFHYRMPPELLTRAKWGFDAPLRNWFDSPGLPEIATQLPELLANHLDSRFVRKLTSTSTSVRTNSRKIWTLLVFYVWCQVHLHNASPDSSLNELIGGNL